MESADGQLAPGETAKAGEHRLHIDSRKRKISAPGGAHRRTHDHAGAARARDSSSRCLSGSDLSDARFSRHIFYLQIASALQITEPRPPPADNTDAAGPNVTHSHAGNREGTVRAHGDSEGGNARRH